jgi:hypothetical protein
MWSSTVYTGKETILNSPLTSKDTLKGIAIVLKLSEPLLHNSYTLWMENDYNSAVSKKFLKLCNTDCVGIIRVNKKAMTQKLQETTCRRVRQQHSMVDQFVSCNVMTRNI